RRVEESDLMTGTASAGAQYFNGAGGCSTCHSPTGDLAGVADRLKGLDLLRRMLYPEGRSGSASPARVTVTLPSGEQASGRLALRNEFTIALRDQSGWYRSWPASAVKFTVDDPRDAHAALLANYTDADMHDVLAYLQTLKSGTPAKAADGGTAADAT